MTLVGVVIAAVIAGAERISVETGGLVTEEMPVHAVNIRISVSNEKTDPVLMEHLICYAS
jgi:hypothetical protein